MISYGVYRNIMYRTQVCPQKLETTGDERIGAEMIGRSYNVLENLTMYDTINPCNYNRHLKQGTVC